MQSFPFKPKAQKATHFCALLRITSPLKKTLAETLATLISLIGTNQEQDHGKRTL
ncbi:Uncharacterised protein [Serratia fonticola]|uniref:Uncharacterized protein n=1 Tax=Serratia fonticola TaxID=47917 RepID=A0A4U9WIL1_SERFO|nr:Uncharacterised protein [Serratia fonticola]CAI0967007.1 Uncharacterised protein [Serratia fonticola]CAI1527025.1 Uncharacterised protein [Serratia fonticola]CAI1757270.1 Uncharacterised protein [Serratia fonticola]CAI1774583.1 Uncharacterised protein [Serratia fonticola]